MSIFVRKFLNGQKVPRGREGTLPVAIVTNTEKFDAEMGEMYSVVRYCVDGHARLEVFYDDSDDYGSP